MKQIILSITLTVAAAAPSTLFASDPSGDLNRFSLGARFGMNFKAKFNNPSPNPGPATGGADHFYDDGYNLLDSSGNEGGVTWNWGYQNESQVVGDTIEFHVNDAASLYLPSSQGVKGDLQPGIELTYQRILSNCSSDPTCRLGLEAGFGFTDLDIDDSRSATGLSTLTTDAYQLDGVLPPSAPYSGTFNGPGALLGDTPTTTFTSDITTVTRNQKLSGQIYAIRLGPFAEWNFTPNCSLSGSLGLTLAPACVDYEFSETSSLAGGATTVASGHASATKLLYGPYVGATLRYDFASQWGVYAGAQFQSLNDLKQSIGARTARLESGATINLSLGVSWRF